MITKFEKYNESIKSLLVGPTRDEAWENVGDFFELETPPDTVDDFLDYIFEISESSIESNIGRVKFNHKSMFCLLIKQEILYIYYKLLPIFYSFYNIKSNEELCKILEPRMIKVFGTFNVKPDYMWSIDN